jgi:hypothetical protein
MARAIDLDLTTDVVSVYDQTKTTVLGRAAKKTLTALQGGKTVVGTPLVTWCDTITDATVTPNRECVSRNGRRLQFVASTAAGVVGMVLYNINETTGECTYVGRLNLQLPATTHTIRQVRLYNDSGATGWRILIGTVGTVAALGGLFSAENIDFADFTASPATIPAATASGQKAVYWHQETGGTNNLTVLQGFGIDDDAGVAGHEIYVANGLVATPNFYKFDAATAISTVLAGGVTSDWYVLKTGTITGMAGTFLLLNNYSLTNPTADSGAPVALQGSKCLFIPTSTNMGFVKTSDILSAVTTLPSYTTRDLLDVSAMNTAVTPATMNWSHLLQRAIMQYSAGKYVVKKFVNAQYELVFGNGSSSQYRTAQPIGFQEWGGITIVQVYELNGWLYTVNNTAGQIGGSSFDLRSLWNYDYSAIISKVINTPRSDFVAISFNAPIRGFVKWFYRLSGFGSATGGWIAGPEDREMTTIPNTTGQIQFKLQPRMERDSVTIPIQIIRAHLVVLPNDESSEFWDFSDPDSTSSSPAHAAFSQVTAYTGSKHWEFFAYNRDTGTLFIQKNTSDHAAEFSISTNDGTSFAPVSGAIASSPLLNVLRYNFSSPPGVKLIVALREKV